MAHRKPLLPRKNEYTDRVLHNYWREGTCGTGKTMVRNTAAAAKCPSVLTRQALLVQALSGPVVSPYVRSISSQGQKAATETQFTKFVGKAQVSAYMTPSAPPPVRRALALPQAQYESIELNGALLFGSLQKPGALI